MIVDMQFFVNQHSFIFSALYILDCLALKARKYGF